jgi:Protein of unknown function (DUF2490)
MDLYKTTVAMLLTALLYLPAHSQNNRLRTEETIGWYGYFGTFKLSDKLGIHTEYQYRRDDLITKWQQGLLRLGVNYQVNPRVLFRAGYAHAETYPYGEYPINGFGKRFTEHRAYQMAQLSHKEGRLDLIHRFMLEQRFVGKYTSADLTEEDQYPLLHRVRYMIRLQISLKGTTIGDKSPYLAAYDEVLIGFGRNVNANVFDQNRIGVLLGYRFNKQVRVEAGYLNQIIQFGRLVDGKNVFQHNHGLIVSGIFGFDLSKKGE